MSLPRILRPIAAAIAIFAPHAAHAAAGDTESFNANITGGTGQIHAIAVQSNGLILIGGNFSAVGGLARNQIARVNSFGTIDSSFNPTSTGTVNCIAVQPDGKILVGTQNSFNRFNADGSRDTAFNPNVVGSVNALAIQSNGSIVIAGNFSSVGGTARNHIARITSTGALDTTFTPNANAAVHSLVVQPDGKVVLGGEFTTIGGTTRNRIARVESTGTLDTTFNTDTNNTVWCLALQPNGQILLGGKFTSVAGNPRNHIARVASNGAIDTTFNPNADNDVYTLVRQADGKILVGGLFRTLQPPGSASPINQRHIARLSSAGALESAFNPVVGTVSYSAFVSSLALQNDGKILLGGSFDYLDGATNGGIFTNHFGRLANDAVTDTVSVPSASQVTWTRGGAAPELTHVILESSTNLASWSPLGTMTRVSTTANWQATGLSLPSTGYVRVRAQANGGFGGGSQSLIEKLISFGGLSTSNAVLSGNGRVIARNDTTPTTLDHTDFGTVFTATTDTITRTFTIQNTGSATLMLGSVSAQLYAFNGSYPSGFGYDGAFTVTSQPASSVAPGDSTTFTIRFNPSGNRQIGTLDYQVYFETNDPILGFGFNIRGTGLNSLPYVDNPIPDISINSGTAWTYQIPFITFRDPDDMFDLHTPTYTTSTRPAWLNFNASTRTFSGTPTSANAGTTEITVTYNDGKGASVSDTFNLTVVAPNVAPTVANPIPDQAATQGVSFTYTFPENTFSDANVGNVFTYSATNLPAWLSFDPSTRTFSGTPGNAHVGFVDITLSATDNGSPPLAVADVFRITVANVNDAPTVANPIPNQPATEDTLFSYTFPTITFADIDAGNVFTYSASGLPAWLNFNPATRTFSGTPNDSHVGFRDITVTATDNGTPTPAAVSDIFRITVTGVNDMPVFTKGADQTLSHATNTLQTLTGWATGISDGDSHANQTLTFLIISNSNPGLFTTAPAVSSNGTLTYTPTGTSGTATIGIALRDDTTAGGAALTTATQTFTITIEDPPLTALEQWRLVNFQASDNTGNGANDFDFDKDSVPNLVEFAFGMNPKTGDAHLLPKPELDGTNLALTYPVPPGITGVTYGAVWSTTLDEGDWHAIPNTGTPSQPVFLAPATGRTRLFIRHAITPQ